MDLAEAERIFWEGYFRIKGEGSTRKDEERPNQFGASSPARFQPYPFRQPEKRTLEIV